MDTSEPATIRPASASDIPRLGEIHITGWRYAYRGIISDRELRLVRDLASQ